MRIPKVYIVGAGPGDPELLTLKAARLIREADVILYDKLVNPEVLSMVSPGCELIFVGKEPRMPCRNQSEINDLIIHAAQRKNTIVRLKGGDPFIFGRGSEECLALSNRGILFEVVPGISSSVAAPAYAGIPLTHRKTSCSFAVITGHEAPDKEESQIPWESLSKIDTLVFLMGVTHRQEIARRLLASGRNCYDLVAFIEKGTTPLQKVLRTTIGELAQCPIHVDSPAVMVIGPVVGLSPALQWFFPFDSEENLQNCSLSALAQ